MLKKILIGLALVLIAFLIVVALQPADFRVERSITVASPPSAPFAQVNDFRNWSKWSPWDKLDPDMKRTYGETTAGTGATYAWEGNKQVGSGNMTITESRADEFVGIRLEFLKPFKATNQTEFSFVPENGGTTVRWVMTGKNNFISKAMCLFMDMDKMIGGDFEKGLAGIKAAAEADAASAPGGSAQTGTGTATVEDSLEGAADSATALPPTP
jgi:hypothetical protein